MDYNFSYPIDRSIFKYGHVKATAETLYEASILAKKELVNNPLYKNFQPASNQGYHSFDHPFEGVVDGDGNSVNPQKILEESKTWRYRFDSYHKYNMVKFYYSPCFRKILDDKSSEIIDLSGKVEEEGYHHPYLTLEKTTNFCDFSKLGMYWSEGSGFKLQNFVVGLSKGKSEETIRQMMGSLLVDGKEITHIVRSTEATHWEGRDYLEVKIYRVKNDK